MSFVKASSIPTIDNFHKIHRMKPQSLIVIFALFFSSILTAIGQHPVYFPSDSRVVNVKEAPYLAKGDGVTDDTDAINQALADHPDGQFIIYLPAGRYMISDRLNWPEAPGSEQSQRYTILQGVHKDSVTIQLFDGLQSYSDPADPLAMVWTGDGAAQRFRNSVRDVTLHTGSNNPGAIGVQFKANNQGGIFNVDVIAGDGQGVIGIDFSYSDLIGPLLVKNVEVRGFDTGIKTNFNVNSMTFENITLRDQHVQGIFVFQQVVTIRNLKSYNEVPAIIAENQGSYLTLIDSELNGVGAAANETAITYGFRAFIRNCTTTGYGTAVKFDLNGTTPVTRVEGPMIDEFVSDEGIFRTCDNVELSLNLPIRETPDAVYDDTSLWVNIEDFGAEVDKTKVDDSEAIRLAMEHAQATGAETIYVPNSSFRNGGYTMDTDVTIPPSVKRIIGCEARIIGDGRFLIAEGSDTLYVERFDAVAQGFVHDAARVLVLKNMVMRQQKYSGTSTADLYLEDVVLSEVTFRDQNVWARQLDTETENTGIINDGGKLWVLGFKTEKRGVKIKTINGGHTEVLGAHIYSIGNPTDEFMFECVESSVSLAGIRETNDFNPPTPYQNLIRVVRNGEESQVVFGEAESGVRASGFPLFVSYVPEGPNQAPVVQAGDEIFVSIDNAIIQVAGTVNDDGLPSGDCHVNTEWLTLSGPTDAIISDPFELSTDIEFLESGFYELGLVADDGNMSTTDTIEVFVYAKRITTADHDGDGIPSGMGGDASLQRRTTNNYGAGQILRVRFDQSNGRFHRAAALKFDISTITNEVLNAGISLEISTTNPGQIKDREYNVFALKEMAAYGTGRLDETWAEGTKDGQPADDNEIIWTNAPGLADTGGGVYDANTNSGGGVNNDQAIFLGQFSTAAGKREVIELRSEMLADMINDDTNGVITLYVLRVEPSSNLVGFASKEHPTFSPPTLYIHEKENFCSPLDPLVVYNFNEGTGDVIYDESGNENPLNLSISDVDNVSWHADGYLSIVENTMIQSDAAASKIASAAQASNRLTVEMWVRSANKTQNGPARIISLSADHYSRNFMVGQSKAKYVSRLRTTTTNDNGSPNITVSGLSDSEFQHVVAVFDADLETVTTYINGDIVHVAEREGDFSNWENSYFLNIADEAVGGREWLGDIDRIAIYDQALQIEEVAANYAAGPNCNESDSESVYVCDSDNVIADYRFEEGSGSFVSDMSGIAPLADLTIGDMSSVAWNATDGLEVVGNTILQADNSQKFYDRLTASNSYTISAWVRPANLTQLGSARIVTYSENTSSRNFTLGQVRTRVSARLRTTNTSDNGTPLFMSSSNTLTSDNELYHIVFSKGDDCIERMYVNGVLVNIACREGDFSNWNEDYTFALANEITMNRPWLGTYRGVTIYDARLNSLQVADLYDAGYACDNIQERSLSNTDKSTSDRQLRVHPNPTNDGVYLLYNFEDGSTEAVVQVLDILGSVRKVANINVGNRETYLALSELPAGVYLLQLSNGVERVSQKVIVE